MVLVLLILINPIINPVILLTPMSIVLITTLVIVIMTPSTLKIHMVLGIYALIQLLVVAMNNIFNSFGPL